MAAEIPPLGPDSDIQYSSSNCNALLCTRKQIGNNKHRDKARKIPYGISILINEYIINFFPKLCGFLLGSEMFVLILYPLSLLELGAWQDYGYSCCSFAALVG